MSSTWNLEAWYECIVLVSCQSSDGSNSGSASKEDIHNTRADDPTFSAYAIRRGCTERYCHICYERDAHTRSGKETYKNVMTEDVALPCVPQVVLAEHAVHLDIATRMLAGMYREPDQVPGKTQDVEMAICCGTGIE